MDYIYYRDMTDDQALELLGIISDESMYVWNDMYIGHLYRSYTGYHGEECSTLAETLIHSYIRWLRVRTRPLSGTNMSKCPGYEREFRSDKDIIKELLDYLEVYTSIREYVLSNNLSKEEIVEYVLSNNFSKEECIDSYIFPDV